MDNILRWLCSSFDLSLCEYPQKTIFFSIYAKVTKYDILSIFFILGFLTRQGIKKGRHHELNVITQSDFQVCICVICGYACVCMYGKSFYGLFYASFEHSIKWNEVMSVHDRVHISCETGRLSSSKLNFFLLSVYCTHFFSSFPLQNPFGIFQFNATGVRRHFLFYLKKTKGYRNIIRL